MNKKPRVSIIIPTWNNESTINICLKSIIAQTYSNIEVIIVDNKSNDKTVEIVQSYNVNCYSLLSSRTNARNFGSKKASGKFLFHIDSDMELTHTLVEECVSLCIEDGFDALIIPEMNISNTFWGKCMDCEKNLHRVSNTGYLRFVSKSNYLKVGGHDDSLTSGEDADLHYRICEIVTKIGFTNSKILHHLGNLTLKSIFKKKLFYAKSTDKFMQKNKTNPKRQKILTLKNMLIIFLSNPILFTGWILIEAFQYTFIKYYKIKNHNR